MLYVRLTVHMLTIMVLCCKYKSFMILRAFIVIWSSLLRNEMWLCPLLLVLLLNVAAVVQWNLADRAVKYALSVVHNCNCDAAARTTPCAATAIRLRQNLSVNQWRYSFLIFSYFSYSLIRSYNRLQNGAWFEAQENKYVLINDHKREFT